MGGDYAHSRRPVQARVSLNAGKLRCGGIVQAANFL